MWSTIPDVDGYHQLNVIVLNKKKLQNTWVNLGTGTQCQKK